MASKEEQKQTESKKSETGLGAELDTDEMLMELQDLPYKKESQLQGEFDFLSTIILTNLLCLTLTG